MALFEKLCNNDFTLRKGVISLAFIEYFGSFIVLASAEKYTIYIWFWVLFTCICTGFLMAASVLVIETN